MFKQLCEDFAAQHGLETIYLPQPEQTIGSVRVEGKFKWYFYKEIDGIRYPFSLTFDSYFYHETSLKEIYTKAEFPFPKPEIMELGNQFIEESQSFFEKYFNQLDVDRIRKITSGANYRGQTLVWKTDLSKVMKSLKNMNRSLKEETVNALHEEMVKSQLDISPTAEGPQNRYLIVFGEKGRQFGEKLEKTMMANLTEIEPDMYAIEPLFPFIKGFKERRLSGHLLLHGSPKYLRNKGILCFVVTEDELKQYTKEKSDD